MGAGVGPSPSQAAGPHYITQGGGTQTYHIFHMPTSQGQVSQYFPGVPGGLLQAATAVPGYHVAAPGTPYFPNFINPMIPANSDFFQPNVKSSNRGGHNSNYKGRGRGGRGGGNNDRNTPHSGAGPSSSQASYASNYQSYNPGAGQQFGGYGGPSQSYAKNNGNRNNWETSSQHSNSSQKKSFSSSSGMGGHEASVNNTPVSPPGVQVAAPAPRMVQ